MGYSKIANTEGVHESRIPACDIAARVYFHIHFMSIFSLIKEKGK